MVYICISTFYFLFTPPPSVIQYPIPGWNLHGTGSYGSHLQPAKCFLSYFFEAVITIISTLLKLSSPLIAVALLFWFSFHLRLLGTSFPYSTPKMLAFPKIPSLALFSFLSVFSLNNHIHAFLLLLMPKSISSPELSQVSYP